jgi:hypothetical protein
MPLTLGAAAARATRPARRRLSCPSPGKA